LFFGLALQEYMASLVDGDSPFDRFHRGDPKALSDQQINGLTLFVNSATDNPPGVNCDFCHALPEFTTASRRVFVQNLDPNNQGFRNIGVRPIADDPGQLNETEPDPTKQATGRFKTPTLRNVELTAPYMHNGGMATLKEVIEFYNRGRSDFDRNQGGADPGGILNLSDAQKEDLIAFLRALTDDRVRFKKAPFDHPQLFVPNGHPLNQSYVRNNIKGNAVDEMLQIPAVGRNGLTTAPRNFLNIQQ
jgi:cytochrome c peroxidase